MLQSRIASIPVKTFSYEDTHSPVTLVRIGELRAVEREGRKINRKNLGLRAESEDEQVFLWKPRKPLRLIEFSGKARPKEQVGKTEKGVPVLQPIDVFSIRDQFLKIETSEQGLSFFMKYGIFGEEHRNVFFRLVGLSFTDLVAWQALVKDCCLSDPATWERIVRRYSHLRAAEEVLALPEFSLGLEPNLHLRLRADCVREAILAAIYLEKLAQTKSSMCRRPDCGVVFNHESQHQRKYCSSDCAHLEAVRRHRARERN